MNVSSSVFGKDTCELYVARQPTFSTIRQPYTLQHDPLGVRYEHPSSNDAYV